MRQNWFTRELSKKKKKKWKKKEEERKKYNKDTKYAD